MQIRPIQEKDAAAVAHLASQLGYQPTAQTVLPNIHAILSTPEHQAFVAVSVDEGEVIGWIHVYTALRLGSLPFAEISGMVVDGAHLQQGIGRALVKQARNWARSRGVAELRVRCNTERDDANAFYQKIGMRLSKTQSVFVKNL